MPIQLSITQPDGTVPTYHAITSLEFDVKSQRVLVHGGSWLDQPHYSDGSPQVAGFNFDISPLLSQPATASVEPFGVQVVNGIEQYLLTLPQFSGGTQVS